MVPSPRSKVRPDSSSVETVNGVSSPKRSDETSVTAAASNTAWKKPVEGENPPAVMGASSWPVLSLSPSKKSPISSQSQVESAGISQHATLPQSVAKRPANDSLSAVTRQCDSSCTNASSPHPPTSSVSPGFESNDTISGPIGGEVGSSSPGPTRSSRPHNNHRGHNSNPRNYTHQRERDHLKNFNNNNNNYSRRHRNYSNESNPNRSFGSRPFAPPQAAQGLIDGPSYLHPPHLPPPRPYTYPPSSLPYMRAPLPPSSGYMYNYLGEHLYFQDIYNPWQFTQPMYMTGGIPPVDPLLHPAPFSSQPPPSSTFRSMANSQSEIANSQPEAQLRRQLLGQIEYYFSDRNLQRDTYLKSQMDSHGWVPISLIAGFNMVKTKTDDISLIIQALQPSARVEIQGDKMRRRVDSDGLTGSPNLQINGG